VKATATRDTLKFEIDGSRGSRSSPTNCAIAVGIKEALGETTRVWVDTQVELVIVDTYVYKMPSWLVEWALAYDVDDLKPYERLPFDAEITRTDYP
jgi:hypothetical protein